MHGSKAKSEAGAASKDAVLNLHERCRDQSLS